MNHREKLGQFLKKSRQASGFSMMTVANYLGLETDSIIAHYESGFRILPNKYLLEVADLLDIDVNKLIELKVNIEKEKIVSEAYERKDCQ